MATAVAEEVVPRLHLLFQTCFVFPLESANRTGEDGWSWGYATVAAAETRSDAENISHWLSMVPKKLARIAYQVVIAGLRAKTDMIREESSSEREHKRHKKSLLEQSQEAEGWNHHGT